ncbi:hypothetical protein ASG29_08730 [Sphingomonas sp. Leaf412]|uniref:hypothetical protein n=1 Tax=Sphingomonas sp. Leaf412 TaxID=1736370 RepID=UPI00072B94AB|nr:hypothetical protein [Sphingomonas sp. Leaf412]KQT31944.1 hypothetical protein ASG29_08730 [Sphingomonas sp. Leaf412]
MNYSVFAEVLVTATLYLESVDESVMDLDSSVRGMEEIAAALQRLEPDEVSALDEALQKIALEYDGEMQESVKNMVRDYGLTDDPDDEDTIAD